MHEDESSYSSLFIDTVVSDVLSISILQQIVSGVGPKVFWFGNLLWDYITYLVPSLLLLVVFAAYGMEAYVEDNRLGLVILILLCFGWAAIPFMYLAHNVFKNPPSGMVIMVIFNILSGLTLHKHILFYYKFQKLNFCYGYPRSRCICL